MTRVAMSVAAAVLVHDNQAGLDHLLRQISRQTLLPGLLIVTDNGSRTPVALPSGHLNSKSSQFLQRLETNVGVGAGHSAGILHSLAQQSVEFVWILEHDTFPEPDCLEQLFLAMSTDASIAVAASRLHRNHYEYSAWKPDPTGPQISPTERFTFNSVMIRRSVFDTIGLPRPDLFVGNEDWDYSNRIRNAGLRAVEVSEAAAIHGNKGSGRFGAYISPHRLYYSARNRIALAEATPSRRLLLTCQTMASGLVALVSPTQGPRHAIARLKASVDGYLGRLGERGQRQKLTPSRSGADGDRAQQRAE